MGYIAKKVLMLDDIKKKIAILVAQAALVHDFEYADEFVELLAEQKRLESAIDSFSLKLSKVNKKIIQNERFDSNYR